MRNLLFSNGHVFHQCGGKFGIPDMRRSQWRARQCLRKRSRCWRSHVYASMAWPSSFLFLVLPVAAAVAVQPQDSELTFLLPAGRQECFYQSTLYNGSMEIEYQVIGGAGLDVDFSVTTPSGILLIMERRRSDGVHTVEPTEAGDYMICFDNSFSTISEKLVFFELIFDNQQGDEEPDSWADIVEPDELLDIKLEDIKESIESVKSRLERSIQMQTVLRAFEARDRNLQESNLDRVTFWSAINVGVLVAVAFLQVYMLKSLFDDKRKIRT